MLTNHSGCSKREQVYAVNLGLAESAILSTATKASKLISLLGLAGAVLLTASDAPTINGLFLMFVVVQAIYGVGVGGEYPVVRNLLSPILLLYSPQEETCKDKGSKLKLG